MAVSRAKIFKRSRINDPEECREPGQMFYESIKVSFEEATKQLEKNPDETRAQIEELMDNVHSQCQELSTITRNENGMPIKVEDRNPDATERETGWVLHRDGIELPDYRIRQVNNNGYQAIVYPFSLTGEELIKNFEEFRTSEPQFPTQVRWTEAVKDLFETLAPRAEPIIGIPEDQWLPPHFT